MTNRFIKYLPNSLRNKLKHRPELLKILDNISWLFFDKILRIGIGLLVGVWVARYLGPEQFGLLSFALAFVGLFTAISTLGLQGIIVREIVRYPKESNKIVSTGFVLQLIGGVITFFIAIIIISYLRPDNMLTKLIVAILGFAQIFRAAEVIKYWYEARVLSKYVVWVENIVFLIIASVKVALIMLKAPLIAFVIVAFIEVFFIAVLLVVLYILKVERFQNFTPSFARAKVLLRDSWPLILSGLAIAVYMKIDQIMLGQLRGDYQVGIYSVAVRLSEIWYIIPTTIVASVFPAIIKAKKTSEKLYIERIQKLYDLMVLIAIVIALPMTFLSTRLVILLFGQEYAEAGPVLAIHIWAAVFVFLGVASSKWFLAENRQILSFQRTFLGAILNVILNLLLIPTHGAIGAACATVVSYAIAALFSDVLQKETKEMFRMKLRSLNLFRTS